MRTIDPQRLKEVSNKVITGTVDAVKSHPGITAMIGLGISWFIVDGMLKQKTLTGQLQEETFPQMKESIEEAVGASVDGISGKQQKALEGVSNIVDENPLMVGLLGVSAGLILGVLSSGMLTGNGFLDETRRTVREKTRQILNETKERAGYVIDAARNAAREEAERQELLPH